MRLIRSAIRVLLAAMLSLLALVVLAVVVAWAFLSTGRGQAWAAGKVSAAVNSGIAGRVAIDNIELRGPLAVRARGVRVYRPDGGEILRATALDATLRPLSLLSREIVLEQVRADGVTGALDEDGSGRFEIAQTFSPRRPAAPAGGPGRALRIRHFELRSGSVRYGIRDQAPVVAIRGGDFVGAITLAQTVRFTVDARAEAIRPVAGPVRAHVRAHTVGGALQFDEIAGTLPGDAELAAAPAASPASRRGPESGPLDGLALQASVPEGALVPWGGPPLAGPLQVQGTLAQRGRLLRVDAGITPTGPGRIVASATLQSGARDQFSVDLHVRGVDPAALLAGAPRGTLFLDAAGRGTIASPPDGALDVQLTLGASTLNRQRLQAGRATVSLRGDQWRAREVQLEGPGLSLAGAAEYAPSTGLRGTVRADVRDLRLAERLADAFRPKAALPPLRGSAWVFARLDGTPGARRLAVQVRSPALTVRGQVVRALRARARLAERRLSASARARTARGPIALQVDASQPTARSITLRRLGVRVGAGHWTLAAPATAQWGGGRIRVSELDLVGTGRVQAAGSLPDPRGRRRGRVDVHAAIDRFPVGLVAAALAPETRAAGFLSGSVDVSGALAAPRIDAVVRGAGLAYQSFTLPTADATVRVEGSHADLTARAFSGALGRAQLTAELDSGEVPLLSSEGLRGASANAVVDVGGVDLTRLSNADLLPLPAAGQLSARMTARGLLLRPALSGTVTLEGFAMDWTRLGAIPPSNARFSFESSDTESIADFETATARVPRIRGHVRVGRNLVELARAQDWGQTPLRGTVAVGPGALRVPSQNLDVQQASVRAKLSGTLGRPFLALDGALRGALANGQPLGDVTLAAAGDATRFEGTLRVATGARGGPLLASFDLDPRAPERWSVSVDAHHTPIDFLAVLPTVVELDGGEIDGHLVGRGAPAGRPPEVSGRLALRAERFTTAQVGTLRQVAVEVESSAGHVRIQKASANAQGGSIEATGDVAFADGTSVTNLQIDLSRFPLPAPAVAFAEVTTRAQLTLTERSGALAGDLRLSRGELVVPDLRAGGDRHPTQLPRDIEVHRPASAAREAQPPVAKARPPLMNLPVTVRISVPDGFLLRAPEANAAFDVHLVMRLVEGNPTLAGSLNVTEGTVLLLGRRFQVDRLALLFTDGAEINPGLDGQLSFQQGETTVLAQVTGTVRKPELQLQSNPPMDSSQIALLVAGGGTGTGGTGTPTAGSGSAVVALSSAISLLASQLGGALGGAVPIDVLDVQVGSRGEAERIEAGTYVTPRLFLAFVRNLFAGPGENFNEVVAEYQLRRSLSLRSRYGDRESGGVSLLWEKRFPSPEQQRQAKRHRQPK